MVRAAGGVWQRNINVRPSCQPIVEPIPRINARPSMRVREQEGKYVEIFIPGKDKKKDMGKLIGGHEYRI